MEWLNWIVAGIAIVGSPLGFYVAVKVNEAVNREKWGKMDKTLDDLKENHRVHFTHASAMDARAATLEKALQGHEALDTERFMQLDRTIQGLREDIRDEFKDLKNLLREK